MTRLEDARIALEAGADWLGFVVKWDGPRRIEPERAAEITQALPGATAVAVMVAPTPDEALTLAQRSGARRVQLHRVDSMAWPADFPLPLTFAVPVAPDGSLTETLPPLSHLVMLDAAHERLPGGTGQQISWESARIVAGARDVMLAGGLDGDVVGHALEHVRPYGVDASSRLEDTPGIKNPDKVRRFVAAVRRFDARDRD